MNHVKTGPRPIDPEQRFWSKVKLVPDGCWLWEGGKNNGGYGHFVVERNRTLGIVRQMDAHRASWLFSFGNPEELFVLHSCDTPACVRPSHLFLGTQKNNIHDMLGKGRHWMQRDPTRARRGVSHPGSKLTEDNVREIRERRSLGESGPSIARAFSVTNHLIYLVCSGKAWSHVL